MFKFIKERLHNENGAVDKILVTLLLIILGVGTIVVVSTISGEKDSDTNKKIEITKE